MSSGRLKISLVVLAATAVISGACSSDGEDNGGTADGLKAPELMHAVPMSGALHLVWMNVQKDCDSVDAERKMGAAAYESAFSVPGSIDNKLDTSATEDMEYTYRLRCKKGSAYSSYSNEVSANPHDMGDGGMPMDSGMMMEGGSH